MNLNNEPELAGRAVLCWKHCGGPVEQIGIDLLNLLRARGA